VNGVPPTRAEVNTQTETTVSVDVAVGGSPLRAADVGIQASRAPGGPTKSSRRRRRRRGSDARTSVSTSPSSNSARRADGGEAT